MATMIQEMDAVLLAELKTTLSAYKQAHSQSVLYAETEKKTQEKPVMTETHNLEMAAICAKFSLSGIVPRPSPAHVRGRDESSVETDYTIQPMRNAMMEIQ